jgi:hypothetical protein
MFTWVERDDREIRERGDQKINNLKLIDNAGDGSKKKKKELQKCYTCPTYPLFLSIVYTL